MKKSENVEKIKLTVILILLLIMCVIMATMLKECSKDIDAQQKTSTPIITEAINPTIEPTTEESPIPTIVPTLTPEPTATLPPQTSPGSAMSTNAKYYGKKVICLTFDDGPHSTITDKILNGLKERNVKATFFVASIGRNETDWESDKRILQRMVSEGHEIGNHTQEHKHLEKLKNEEIIEQFAIVNDRVKEMADYDIKTFRPPYGTYEKRVLEVSNMAMVHFSVDSNDWKYLTKPAIQEYAKANSLTFEEAKQQRVKFIVDALLGKTKEGEKIPEALAWGQRQLKHGAIILFHDLYEGTVDLALSLIDELTKEGYVFLTVTDAIESEGGSLVPGEAYKSIWEGYQINIPTKW